MTTKLQYEREFDDLSRNSNFLEIVAFATAIAVSIVYLYVEYRTTHTDSDFAFVLLLLASTAVLLIGERFTQNHFLHAGLAFFAYSLDQELGAEVCRAHLVVSGHLYQSKRRIQSGVAWGGILAFAPYLLSVWSNDFDLRLLLSLFLFLVNYITGNAVYTLIRFLLDLTALSKIMKIDVWNSRNPSTAFYVESILQVALFASVYVSVSMSSILFSKFDRTFIVYAYAALSFGIMLLTLVYPYVRIARCLIRAKREVQYRIGRRLHILTDAVLVNSARPEGDTMLEEMRRLIELRKSVDDAPVLPFRTISISAVTLMAFVFSHPFILQWALKAHVVLDALKITKS